MATLITGDVDLELAKSEAFRMMAFLQRVLNGGGHIDREYAAVRGRMDLLVEYNERKYVIEIKLVYEK